MLTARIAPKSDTLFHFTLSSDANGFLRSGHVHYTPQTGVVNLVYADGKDAQEEHDRAILDALLHHLDDNGKL